MITNIVKKYFPVRAPLPFPAPSRWWPLWSATALCSD